MSWTIDQVAVHELDAIQGENVSGAKASESVDPRWRSPLNSAVAPIRNEAVRLDRTLHRTLLTVSASAPELSIALGGDGMWLSAENPPEEISLVASGPFSSVYCQIRIDLAEGLSLRGAVQPHGDECSRCI